MMTFYAAAGSYQIRNEDGKDMPYIFLHGNWSKERDDPFKSRARVYVLKTLKQDKESYLAVGMLVNLICYYANEFVATHLDRFD